MVNAKLAIQNAFFSNTHGYVMLNLVQHLGKESDPEIVDPELDSGHGSG
jgi:hypothetical protein